MALKVATVVCAVAGLFVLEAEGWLQKRHRYGFTTIIVIVSAVYLGFVGFAINHAVERAATKAGLKAISSASTPLIDRQIPLAPKNNETAPTLNGAAVDQFERDYLDWERTSAAWIREHLGDAAHDHFLDRSNITSFSQWGLVADFKYDHLRNLLSGERRNLISIMESRIYD